MLVTATESNFAAGDRSVGLGPNRGGSLLSQTSPVPIIPLPGITLANFASRHVEQWFHISRAKLCYQSQFLPPSQVAITLVYRYQPPARAPIDAGKWCQVMEKERVIASRFFEESQ